MLKLWREGWQTNNLHFIMTLGMIFHPATYFIFSSLKGQGIFVMPWATRDSGQTSLIRPVENQWVKYTCSYLRNESCSRYQSKTDGKLHQSHNYQLKKLDFFLIIYRNVHCSYLIISFSDLEPFINMRSQFCYYLKTNIYIRVHIFLLFRRSST